MASKKRRGPSVKLALLWIVAPLVLWAAAFAIWLGWPALGSRLRADHGGSAVSNRRAETPRKAAEVQSSRGESRETIFEEDRRKLDQILKDK